MGQISVPAGGWVPSSGVGTIQENVMKFVNYVAVFMFAISSLTIGALAKDKNEGKFTLNDSAQVGSTQLKAGDYKITWEGSGADVQVKILQGKEVVATTSAKLVDKASTRDSVTLSSGSPKKLQEIDFSNTHKALVFSAPEAAQN
jgi:hypothetical protein